MMPYFIEHEGLVHGKTQKIQALWSPLLNGCIYSSKDSAFCMRPTQLVRSWQDALSFLQCAPSSDREFHNSLQNEVLVSSRVLYSHGKEKLRYKFQCLFRLGVVHLGYVVDNESQRLSEFEDTKQWLCIIPNYGFIWEKLQDIPLLHGSLPLKTNVAPWVDWQLQNGTHFLQVTTNTLYHHVMTLLSWLSPRAEKV